MRSAVPRFRLITDATSEPVSLADARAYARIDDTSDDATVTSLIANARRHIERITGLALLTQTWVAVFDRWPGAYRSGLAGPWWDGVRDVPLSMLTGSDPVNLIKQPFQSVTQIQLRDAYGALSSVDPSIYYTSVSDYRGLLMLKLGQVWPTIVLAPAGAIEVTMKLGFGDVAANVPEDLTTAVKVFVKHFYDNRDLLNEGNSVPQPHHVDDLLRPWKALRLR